MSSSAVHGQSSVLDAWPSSNIDHTTFNNNLGMAKS